jgi:hypothetical protein
VSPPCWTCRGAGCALVGAGVSMGLSNSTGTASTTVSLVGGSNFKLLYKLQSYTSGGPGGPPNLWLATIGSTDNSFPSILVDQIVDYPSDLPVSQREVAFTVPAGTRAVTLTFTGRNVRPSDFRLVVHSVSTVMSYCCQEGVETENDRRS